MAETDVTVIEMKNPAGMFLPEVWDLFEAAFEREDFPEASHVLEWCAQHSDDHGVGILLARNETGAWKGMAIVQHEPSVWWPHPIVLAIYADGKGIRRALTAHISEWIKERGASTVLGINLSGLPDEAFMEKIAEHASGEIMGSAILCQLTDQEKQDG